jgi:hypothetical protein
MYTNRYNAKEDEPTIYCTPSRYANRYTTEEIYHTHDLLHYSGVKYTNRYNTKEDEPTPYCTSNRHVNTTPQRRYTTRMIYNNIVESNTVTFTTQRRMNPRSTAHQTGMQTATPQRRYTTCTIYYIMVESSTLTVTTQRRMNPRSTAHQTGMLALHHRGDIPHA